MVQRQTSTIYASMKLDFINASHAGRRLDQIMDGSKAEYIMHRFSYDRNDFSHIENIAVRGYNNRPKYKSLKERQI